MSTPLLSPRPRHPSTQPRSRPARTPAIVLPSPPLRSQPLKTPSKAIHTQKPSSPNYFGLALDARADVFASSAAQHIRGNWSPPTSDVQSTAAASPRMIPVDQNPEFEQFKRQSDLNFSKGFSFDIGNQSMPSLTGSADMVQAPPSPESLHTAGDSSEQLAQGEAQPIAKPRSPKRLLSSESGLVLDRPRRNSPASFQDTEGYGRTEALAQFAEASETRPPMPAKDALQMTSQGHHRAETLPSSLNNLTSDGPNLATPQHVVNILESAVEEVLLLDLRVSTQYAAARIVGALNLCIPTTLLKRATFSVQKLADTFRDVEQRQKFENWRSSKHIIVYDAHSSQLKDATICINTLKKFTSDNWSGSVHIIRGGFQEFSSKFPSWVSRGPISTSGSKGLSPKSGAASSSVPPVIGGCPMPATQNAANPFFGNIRQNMDLIGGVGQMAVKKPTNTNSQFEEDLPRWLQRTAHTKDDGKIVSDSFLNIEKREQQRMQEALSGNVTYGSPTGSGPTHKPDRIEIAGIEKGSKNRYNSIWPYEHSRVKLQGVQKGGCDYVNANHVTTSLSNKRYIATQGPLPATFNDFWKVVWQQDVRVIVMLTAESEGGQLKAHNYWSEKQYGHLHLNQWRESKASLEPAKIQKHRDSRPALGQRRSTIPAKLSPSGSSSKSADGSEPPYVTVRNFTLSNDEHPFERMREVTQLQYSHWPDFGAPAHPTHLLGLIEQCDAVCRSVNGHSPERPESPDTRPILVHCSAGCGRTGTFCTVDSVLDMLKRQRHAQNQRPSIPMELTSPSKSQSAQMSRMSMDDNPRTSPESGLEETDDNWVHNDDLDLIAKTVEEFRLQRLSMVQSLRQFVLCYETVLEWLAQQHPQSE